MNINKIICITYDGLKDVSAIDGLISSIQAKNGKVILSNQTVTITAMTQVEKDYGVASVIGIFVFIVVATFSLITYSRSNAVKNEGDFQ